MRNRYDVALVLGGNINPDGQPGRHARMRTERAAELYKSGVVNCIVFCGKYSVFRNDETSELTEAEAMASYAKKLGVPSKYILKEEESRTTVQNGYFFKKNILNQKKFKSVFVVTTKFHSRRVGMIFHKLLDSSVRCDIDGCVNPYSPPRHRVKELLLTIFTRIGLIGVKRGDEEAVLRRLSAHFFK